MRKITFADIAWKEYLLWQDENKKVLKKINGMLNEICRTPYTGTGMPEQLKYIGHWSRRITKKDRIIYDVTDDEIIVLQCKGHYEDK